jgi:cytochrome oxidase assembly protein ShyY1
VYRFLLSRQWVVLTLIGLVLMPVMVKLGIWQMHRHEQEDANNALIRQSLAAPTVPVEKLTVPGARVASHDNFRSVTATGRYDTAHQVVVRHRTSADDSAIGYYLITPLVMADGRAVLVNRGWIPAPQNGDDAQFPALPPTPSGRVSITGRIRPDESTASTGIVDRPGLPPRMIMLINSGKLAKQLPEPVLGGYVELTSTSPSPTGSRPQPVPTPTPGQSNGGYHPPHLAYAWQWWLFVAMVPVGWVILVRRELKDRRAHQAKPQPCRGQDPVPGSSEDGAPGAVRDDSGLTPEQAQGVPPQGGARP